MSDPLLRTKSTCATLRALDIVSVVIPARVTSGDNESNRGKRGMTETIKPQTTPPSTNANSPLGFAAGLCRGDHAGRHRDFARAGSVLSLPEVVAEGILARMPGALFSSVPTRCNTPPPLFYVSVGVGMLLVGGALGRWYGGEPGWKRASRIVIGCCWVRARLYRCSCGIFGRRCGRADLARAVAAVVFVVLASLCRDPRPGGARRGRGRRMAVGARC